MRVIAFFPPKNSSSLGKIVFGFIIIFLTVGFYLWGKNATGAEKRRETQNQFERFEQKEDLNSSKETRTLIGNKDIEGKTYRNKKYGYEVKYPEDWEVREAKPREGPRTAWTVNILLEEELQKVTFLETEYKLWQGSFQVRVMSNKDNLSLEQWIEKHEPQDVTGGSLIQGILDTTLNEILAKKLSIFGFDHEEIEIVTLYEGNIYSLIFAGINPNDPNVERHIQIYDQMVSSFAFIE